MFTALVKQIVYTRVIDPVESFGLIFELGLLFPLAFGLFLSATHENPQKLVELSARPLALIVFLVFLIRNFDCIETNEVLII